MNADEYRKEHRAEYEVIKPYVLCAQIELSAALQQLSKEDPIYRGVTAEQGSSFFQWLHAVAEDEFAGRGPFESISVVPDPFKSPGVWRITAVTYKHGTWEGHVHNEDLIKHYDKLPKNIPHE